MTDLARAEEAAHDDVVAVCTQRDLLVVAGPDAGEYLQGQLSQDVTGLAVGETTRTLLLQPQGKVDAWGRLHRHGRDEYWLDVEAGHGEATKGRLERFKLRVDAEIRLSTVGVVALRGPRSSEVSASLAGDSVVALPVAWPGLDGVDLVTADGSAPAVPDGVVEGPSELIDLLRAFTALPAMGAELDENTIPAAAGVVDASVDFTKGCYVGQELVARIDSRGNNTPTRLHRLRFELDDPSVVPPGSGAELLLDDEPVGTVTTAASSPRLGRIGLGYLKRSVEAPAELTARCHDGASIRVLAVAPSEPDRS